MFIVNCIEYIFNKAIEPTLFPEMPERAFMGFGYNPALTTFGERLDMLDYIDWMFMADSVKDWTFWDASSYAVAQKIKKKKAQSFWKNPSGKDLVSMVLEEQDKPCRAAMMANCDVRGAYLNRIIDVTGINASYIDARTVFKEDQKYTDAVDVGLATTEMMRRDYQDILDMIFPKGSDNPSSEFYLPLEIAEAIYLQETKGIRAKFGPRTERYFDASILVTQDLRSQPQIVLWPAYEVNIRRAGYLSDGNVIWTSSSDQDVGNILQRDNIYKVFVETYLGRFQQQGEPFLESVKRMRDAIELPKGDAQ